MTTHTTVAVTDRSLCTDAAECRMPLLSTRGRCSEAGAHNPCNIPGVPFQRTAVSSVEEERFVDDSGLIQLLRERVAHAAAGEKKEGGAGLERVMVAWRELHEVCEMPVEPGACYRVDANTVFRAAPVPVVPMYLLQKRHDSITFVHGSMREKLYPLCFLGTERMHLRHGSMPSDAASVSRLHATQPTKETRPQDCSALRAYVSTPTCLCRRWSRKVRTRGQERSATWLGLQRRSRSYTSGLIAGARTTPHDSTAPSGLKTVPREAKAFSRRRRSRWRCQNAL